jgi:uncharacterized protein YciI
VATARFGRDTIDINAVCYQHEVFMKYTFCLLFLITASFSISYDAELARKLGADERGMRNYVLVILKTGPKDATITGKEREEIFAGHFANIERLANEKKLAVAGPFEKNELTFRGLYIFSVNTLEEAQQLTKRDPAVAAGIFEPVLVPWYGSAALMETNEIHKKMIKPK